MRIKTKPKQVMDRQLSRNAVMWVQLRASGTGSAGTNAVSVLSRCIAGLNPALSTIYVGLLV